MKPLAFATLLLATAFAHAAPPDASKLLADAKAQAKKERKSVLVVFHASWCGWCKKFEAMLNDPKLQPTFDRNYVIVRLDVLESATKKDEENPGGEATMAVLGGKDAGLPFFAILSPDGSKLGDSLITPGNAKTNTGHPSAPEEIAHFMALLKSTAKKANEAQRGKVEAYLKADAAKR